MDWCFSPLPGAPLMANLIVAPNQKEAIIGQQQQQQQHQQHRRSLFDQQRQQQQQEQASAPTTTASSTPTSIGSAPPTATTSAPTFVDLLPAPVSLMAGPTMKGHHHQYQHNARHHNTKAKKSTAAEETKHQREERKARELILSAEGILKDVDDSPLLQKSEVRRYPTFERDEVSTGPLLGVGGFCSVYEVRGFNLVEREAVAEAGATSTEEKAAKSTAEKTGTSNGGIGGDPVENGAADDAGGKDKKGNDAELERICRELGISEHPEDGDGVDGNEGGEDGVEKEDEEHYDVDVARRHMRDNARRGGAGVGDGATASGDARYAIKRLHHGLGTLERARGTIDLAIEARFLSVLWHPNIVKMRAVGSGPSLHHNFFIVMDRLYQTLDKRVKEWRDAHRSAKGNIFGIGAKKEELRTLLLERMVVAYDLASAFEYMHENRLVYRDVKKENIAFDVRGDVKIFDFGLSKALSPSLKAKDSAGREIYGYNLTPRTGSIPFMAPEIVECKPYDEKCDVFSFAILLWEILAMQPAFKGYNRRDFLELVVRNGQRLPIERQWPPLTRGLLKEAWDGNPKVRPTMHRIGAMMSGDLRELSTDPKIINRSNYMNNRSQHSIRRLHRKASKLNRIQTSKHSKHSF